MVVYCKMKECGDCLKCIRCGNTLPLFGGKLPQCGVQYPDMVEQISGLTQSIFKYAYSGFGLSSDNLYKERYQICEKCDFLDNNRCLKCGCFFKAKLKIATESCPINKWGPVNSGNLS